MRKNIVAGNWKMNKTLPQAIELINEIKNNKPNNSAEVILATPFPYLAKAIELVAGSDIKIAAQNMHQAEGGAFTGEVSAAMLTSIGVTTVILGHSERRAYFHENDALLANKVDTALAHDMTVIFCFGEELKDRQSDNHFNVVEYQLRDGLFHISKENWKNIVLAYEPVWAIGTGLTATPEQAQEVHASLRAQLALAVKHPERVKILYGGSMNASNAAQLLAQTDIDGGLIGGASLKAPDFLAILGAASALAK